MMNTISEYFKSVVSGNLWMLALTFNPGYTGGTKIPESLNDEIVKIDYTIPQMTQILQVMLAGEGFLDSRFKPNNLGLHISCVCTNLSMRLTKRHWYDFGMRQFTRIVSVSGSLLRSGMSEAASVQQALQDTFTPSLDPQDVVIAKQILSGLTNKTKKEMLTETLKVKHAVLAISHKSTGFDNKEYKD
mmetsp:Transcript_51003/g.42866  ORF Transcript_51003/g.42866 Transcript_51003/m.42866 type:complete len:188 (-) Transcript_51003:399-962(-)